VPFSFLSFISYFSREFCNIILCEKIISIFSVKLKMKTQIEKKRILHFNSNQKNNNFDSLFFLLPNTRLVNNHLKHLGRTRLGVLIRPVWLLHHFYLVYRWRRGSNSQPSDREPSLLPTRPQFSLPLINLLLIPQIKGFDKKLTLTSQEIQEIWIQIYQHFINSFCIHNFRSLCVFICLFQSLYVHLCLPCY